jgi:hypothetical protein
LALSPYAGAFITLLIFEDCSAERITLMKKAYGNTSDYDLIQYMTGVAEIENAEEYFDPNRMIKIRDRYQSDTHEVWPIVE